MSNGQCVQGEDAEYREMFESIDRDGSGYIDASELDQALKLGGLDMPMWKQRQYMAETSNNNQLNLQQFKQLCINLKSQDISNTFKKAVSKRQDVETLGGTSVASAEGTTHSVRHEEQIAFTDWINQRLGDDKHLQHLMPVNIHNKDLYKKVGDGLLLCKLINSSAPHTIDERVLNGYTPNMVVFKKSENLTLALNSARAIGCNVVNIDGNDLLNGVERQHLVLGLIWQIIRIGLFNQINLEHCPGLANLLEGDETLEDLMRLSPEEILLRWVNYHLANAGVDKRIKNFSSDIKDSEAYSYLLKQIAPPEINISTTHLRDSNMTQRAEATLIQADKLECRQFVGPNDITSGNQKLNVAFVANLFNKWPGLTAQELPEIVETREEKTYRNWMNSMGVSPHVNWLYSDLADGIIIFQLYDIIKPGSVYYKRVHTTFTDKRRFMEQLENCNYAVELGRENNFSLVGIAGQDIKEGNRTLTLAVVWQLMRAYTLTMLSQLINLPTNNTSAVEQAIVKFVNDKLEEAGKTSQIRGFQDQSIRTSRPVADLVDALRPGHINYDMLSTEDTEEARLANAKYSLSMARKVGARIYALPEDIAEVRAKMVMTVFACLMALEYLPTMGGN